jgi:hypothetical protein
LRGSGQTPAKSAARCRHGARGLSESGKLQLYELVEENAGHGMVRIIDESGEDYLYPSSWFEPIEIRESVAVRLHDAIAKLAA